jgi:hypothetical protein
MQYFVGPPARQFTLCGLLVVSKQFAHDDASNLDAPITSFVLCSEVEIGCVGPRNLIAITESE